MDILMDISYVIFSDDSDERYNQHEYLKEWNSELGQTERQWCAKKVNLNERTMMEEKKP